MEPAHEADCAPSSADVKKALSYTSVSQCACTLSFFFLQYFKHFTLTAHGHHKLNKQMKVKKDAE